MAEIITIRKTELDNAIRRQIVQNLASLYGMESLRVLRSLPAVESVLPDYVVHLPTSFRYGATKFLVPLSTKQSGKRRIYCSSAFVQTPKDIYLSYMSKKDVIRILGRQAVRLPESIPFINSFSDRWIVTIGKAANKFDNIRLLYKHVLMIENEPSKGNRPPNGSNDKERIWRGGSNLMEYLSKDAMSYEMICSVNRYR